ncbi:Phosphatidic acid phosphatase type 2/haloperoxidase - like 7 [Theobroma cacao]|nr:Phosphatidic acid phosphatase type 2/haloperoxidase - like 7 [Theobroma cacao]
MGSIAAWQGVALCGIFSWIVISTYFNVTKKIRSLLQPRVAHRVVTGTSIILKIQKHQHKLWDGLFSVLSSIVSVPFYTAFLPLLFWSGHGKLARQMTLLMAFCDYMGNCIKDVVSAPRPSCPPVRRITATKDEEDNALEYGLPSSHTLNTVCLSGYLLYYVLSSAQSRDACVELAAVAFAGLLVGLIGVGRIYLGMHSLIDIIGGLAVGLSMNMWMVLLSQDKTVAGIQQTYHQFHHEAVPQIFTSQLTIPAFLGRMLVGIPTILIVKFCSKALAKWILPVVSNTLGIPIKSTSYIPMLNGSAIEKKSSEIKQSSYVQKMLFFSRQDLFDVDTGIRFLQYAGLAWSVVDLVPSLFSYLRL